MHKLTDQERSVLDLCCQGYRMKAIALKLNSNIDAIGHTVRRARLKYKADTVHQMCYLHGVAHGTQL